MTRGQGVHSSLAWLALSALFACDPKGEGGARFSGPQMVAGEEISAATLENGRTLFGRYCASCHGADGGGNGPASAQLKHPPRDLRRGEFAYVNDPLTGRPSHAALVSTIREGVVERGMPAWKGLRDEDLEALARYVETLSPRWSEAAAPTGKSGS